MRALGAGMLGWYIHIRCRLIGTAKKVPCRVVAVFLTNLAASFHSALILSHLSLSILLLISPHVCADIIIGEVAILAIMSLSCTLNLRLDLLRNKNCHMIYELRVKFDF